MGEIHQNPETRIALFQRKEIRRIIHDNEWWFVVEDVVLALIDSRDAKQYIQRMKQRDPELQKGWVQIVHTLSVPTGGGPQNLNCSNTTIVRRPQHQSLHPSDGVNCTAGCTRACGP